ncbi:hypothetical protein [Fodinibius halophilus]|uniref:Cupin domain-containing protein n=1 Tax=Fodinibius halophilus TaxID=1736908 RepID=A0A6M1T8V4_9BACT|nr:hypothetical protein [Fodinibius halophilus]NGP86812.1 hypothetical protein [Fodinibius halophilus]
MSTGHIVSGEPINLENLTDNLQDDSTYALVKTSDMEVIRMYLPHGKCIEEHSVEGEMSIHCLKGDIFFNIDGQGMELTEDDWLYLEKEQSYSYSVKSDTILLVTILFNNK